MPFAPSAPGLAARVIPELPEPAAVTAEGAEFRFMPAVSDGVSEAAAGAEAAGAVKVAVSLPVTGSFLVVTGTLPLHSGLSGVVTAHAGTAVKRRREPQLPP
ncbi:hypothetical protein SAVIM338S_04630 [Streptomyces avidinii]